MDPLLREHRWHQRQVDAAGYRLNESETSLNKTKLMALAEKFRKFHLHRRCTF